MSVKKILSIIMALAIVLTMASFPAFAADAVAIIAAHGNLAQHGAANTSDKAFDGDLSTKFVANQYKDPTANGTYAVVFELENTVTLDTLTINWGGNSWGLTGPDKYNVYVSADNAEYEQILTYEGLYTKDTAAATYSGLTYVAGYEGGVNVTYDMVETGLNKDNVKFIKIECKRWNGRPAFREIAVTGTLGGATPEPPADPTYAITVVGGTASHEEAKAGIIVTLTADPAPEGKEFDRWVITSGAGFIGDATNPNATFAMSAEPLTIEATYKDIPKPKPEVKEDTVEALGANIRLATETVSAGLRFGATVNKADLLIEGDYVYDEASDVQLGMYLLPAEMLAESETLEAYIAAGKTEALDVPAKKVYAQDDETVTFTAVLVDIPAEAYAKEIVAVPYVKVAEDVTYFEEKDQSYAGVAQAALDANEAGTVTLTEDQIKSLKDILGIEEEPAAATYTVNYVDAEGNAIAVAKNGAGFVGDEVTETAVEVEGYTADKASETITLVDGVNTITFTYTKNEEPAPEEPAGDPVPVAIIAAHGNLTIDGSKNVAPNAYDGDLTTKFVPNQYKGSTANGTYAVVFELENTVTLDTLTINWGGSTWGQTGPDKYNVYVSADNVEFEQILTYEGLYTKDTAAATYSGLTYVTGYESGVNVTYDMVETGLNKENVKFIKIECKRWNGRPAFREVSVTGIIA